MRAKQTGYANIIFVVLNETKTKLQFTNSDKWYPVHKKWSSVKRDMVPGTYYAVATVVTPSESESGTSWNVLGLLGALRNKAEAEALNENYWSELAGHPTWSAEVKTRWTMEWATELVMNYLPEEHITRQNQMTWRLMKLFQDPEAFTPSVEKIRMDKISSLFEF